MPRLVDDQLFGTDRKVVDPDLIDGGLRSKQFATVLDLLGYGEIDSIFDVGGAGTNTFQKNIFLDGTPLKNANGDNNFQDVEVFFKNGASNQTAMQEINAVETTVPVSAPVTNSASVTRSITNTSVDKIRVSIQIPALQEFKEDGDIVGAEVKISIKITENDGTVSNPVVENAINGKATSPFVKDFEIKFERTMSFPIDVTVIRNTADSTESRLQNATNFLSLTEIITDSSAYQGFAYVALRFNAQEFQSYPKRMYRIKGTKIKVPHGTTIDSNNGRVIYPSDYTFNGTFKTNKEWCSDPAWILYDLLTTDKGFGGTDGVIDENTLDVFSFYSASAYNSELITDPITGTTEPRFSCNVILNQKNDAFTLINDLCSVMRATPFYSVGSLTLSQDRPTNITTNTSDAQYIFTNANVSEQGFSYSGIGQKTKFTEVEVSYFDNDTQSLNFEYVSADEITALSGYTTKFGKIRKTLKSFACTSRGQANRLARWFLYTNLKESELCTFKTTLEAGVVVRPSTIIGVADSLRAGVRRGGRIKSVTNTTTIVVDDANNTDLTAENSATLSVIMPDGSTESRSISSISGTTITVSSAFSTSPQANSIWAIENTTVEFQTYRVLGIEETNHCEYNISAIIHDTNKYSQVEDATVAANPRTITTLLDEKPSPSNASAVEQIVVLNNRAVSKIFVAWEPVQGVKEYLLEFQYENDNPERHRISRPSFELFESRLGSYTFKIKSYNTLGKLSSSTTNVDVEAIGKTALPADVQNLTVEPISDQLLRLRFDKSTDVDVTHGGAVVVRHSNVVDGSGTFTNSVDLVPAKSGATTEILIPAVTGEVILKFRDDGGRLSSGETSAVITVPDAVPKLAILTDREDTDATPFSGSKTNCFVSSVLGGLVLDSDTLFDSFGSIDSLTTIDFQGGMASSGHYDFASNIDFGNKQPVNLTRHFVTESVYPTDLIDSRTALVDLWTDIDALTAFDTNARLLVAITDLDPDLSVSATYSQSGNTITITKSSHGYIVGNNIVVDFTSGNGVDGEYEIQTVPNANTFTITSTTSQTTSGNCTYGANFTAFEPMANGTFIGRGFKFRAELTSADPAQSIVIKQVGYSANLIRRSESPQAVIASGTSRKSVSFINTYFTGTSELGGSTTAHLPTIGIILENMQSGDFFSLHNITGSGFDIDVKNGSSFVDRNFRYTAVGFGRGS